MLTYLLVNDEAVCLKLYQLLKLVIPCHLAMSMDGCRISLFWSGRLSRSTITCALL